MGAAVRAGLEVLHEMREFRNIMIENMMMIPGDLLQWQRQPPAQIG
jgi:hypothetical protein